MDYKKESLKMHEDNRGKIEIKSKIEVKDKTDLSLAYSPGVAEPSLKIYEDVNNLNKYTNRGNTIAIVSDGSAVLGLGNIGARASLPVMEGKSVLFKEFAGIDCVPIILDTNDVDEIVKTVKNISPGFSGINLEDISAPRCFEIEERLKEELDIPVFHDDQHGTAIVVLAGIINSLKIVLKKIEDVKIVINGSGAAGVAILKLLKLYGAKNIIILDSKGAISKDRNDLNGSKKKLLDISNPDNENGALEEVIRNADIFVGVSVAGALTQDMVGAMNKDSIIFGLANPVPEIMPDLAKEAGARIVATGRSDFPNQVNNVLAFPGIFRGALDSCAKKITDEMKIAAAKAISSIVSDNLSEDRIIPDSFNLEVVKKVSEAVKNLA